MNPEQERALQEQLVERFGSAAVVRWIDALVYWPEGDAFASVASFLQGENK